MILIDKFFYREKPKKGGTLYSNLIIATDFSIGFKIASSPRTPFFIEVGLGIINFSYSVNRY